MKTTKTKLLLLISIALLFVRVDSNAQGWTNISPYVYTTVMTDKVGIGTAAPSEKLQVEAGSIYIRGEEAGLIVDEGSNKRTGFIKYTGRRAGIWRGWNGSVYEDFEIGRVNVTALPGAPTNFQTDIYINALGNVGIGTIGPQDKFQVNDGAYKLGIGSAFGQDLGYGTSYVGFNAVRRTSGWSIATDGLHNGGAAIWSQIGGEINFASIGNGPSPSINQSLSDADIMNRVVMHIRPSGNVGIGNVDPQDKLQVNDGAYKLGIGSAFGHDLGYGTSYIGFNAIRAYGSWSITSDGANNGGAVIWSQVGGEINFASIGNSGSPLTNQTLTDADIRSRVAMHIHPNGQVGIGTINMPDNNYKLYVIGGIKTEKVLVEVASLNGWADYVFNSDYKLMPLSELEEYVNVNKHLPEIPSACEVVENGVELSEMQAKLLKKIEELTLYVISQQKEIDGLKTQLKK